MTRVKTELVLSGVMKAHCGSLTSAGKATGTARLCKYCSVNLGRAIGANRKLRVWPLAQRPNDQDANWFPLCDRVRAFDKPVAFEIEDNRSE
jgi:hypothetical protein